MKTNEDDDINLVESGFIILICVGAIWSLYDLIHNVSVWWSEACVQVTL